MSKGEIDVYDVAPHKYQELQMLRPDYAGAKKVFIDLALRFLEEKENILLADFCSGTGSDTKLLADRLPVAQATLIDVNEKFLEIAQNLGIRAELVCINSDILDAKLHPISDAVISMFAYHHVPDKSKAKYLEQVKRALKPGGILLLGEIYMPDRKTTMRYYEELYEAIPDKSPELKKFLTQTAESDSFEYKVSKAFADEQLTKAGFKCLDSTKIWPKDDRFSVDIGTFVEVWQI